MQIDISIEDPRWEDLDLHALARGAADAALARLGIDPAPCEISLLAADDARIAVLNADFRGKAGPTNVLSWPAEDLCADTPGGQPLPPEPDPDGTLPLGDIALAFETCAREAADGGKPLDQHVTHLIVHGLLHLLGYDHLNDPDAALMEDLEREILGKLGVPDPYNGQ